MREARFLFGRLNLMAQYADKLVFLLAGLRARKTLSAGSHTWGLFDVFETYVGDNVYIVGHLVKLRPASEEETADLEKHLLSPTKLRNRAVAKSLFLLHVRTGLIAYHPVSGQISDVQFRKNFAALLESGHDHLFVDSEIQPVEDRFRLIETLASFELISELVFNLHPTNPNYDILCAATDRRLKELEAASYAEVYRAHPGGNGLNVKNDDEIKGKIAMAEDGYGEAAATGRLNGEKRRVSTGQNPITAMVPLDLLTPDRILYGLRDAFESLLRRFTQ